MKGPSALCPLLSTQKPTEKFIEALSAMDSEINLTIASWTDQGIMDPKASLYKAGPGLRQWAYQTCTEIGDAGIIPTDPTQTIEPTSIANYETQEAQCLKVFGIHFTADPEHGIDEHYFKPLIASNSKVRNVLITEDTADPTTTLGVQEAENQNPGLIVYPVEGAAHHQELSTPSDNDSQPIQNARQMILNTVRAWLQK